MIGQGSGVILFFGGHGNSLRGHHLGGLQAAFEVTTAETVGRSMLNRAATLADVGNAAEFAASDWARTMSVAALNITCGAFVD